MRYILILLTTFTLSAFAADGDAPKIDPVNQTQDHKRPEIKDPVLKAKLIEMKELREKMEALRKEIKELAEKDGIKLPHKKDGQP